MADFKSPFSDAVVPKANPNPNRGEQDGEPGFPKRSGHAGGVNELVRTPQTPGPNPLSHVLYSDTIVKP